MDPAVVEQAHPPAHVGAAAERFEATTSLSYSFIDCMSADYDMSYGALAVSQHLWFPPGLELGAGGRFGFGSHLQGNVAGEAFLALTAAPHFRTMKDETALTASWRPSAGVELGVSSARLHFIATAQESIDRRDGQPGPVYATVLARPLRFRFSGYAVTAIGFAIGAPLADVGSKVRFQLEVLQVGWIW